MPESREIEVYKYFLKPGYIFTSPGPALISTVLGSCVAVTLFDKQNKCGGMNHFLFPNSGRRNKPTPQYGNVALAALIRMLLKQGSRIKDMEAQIFGGGKYSMRDKSDTGRKNVKMARKMISKKGIPIVSEDVGGFKGRRIVLHSATNEALVMRTDKIRRGDWSPYRLRPPKN